MKIEDVINHIDEKDMDNIDWNKAWAKKYPILSKYTNEIDCKDYENKLKDMLEDLMNRGQLTRQDAFLVLKDILYTIYKDDRK